MSFNTGGKLKTNTTDTENWIRGTSALSWDKRPTKEELRKVAMEFFVALATKGPDEAFKMVNVPDGQENFDSIIKNLHNVVGKNSKEPDWYTHLAISDGATDGDLDLTYPEKEAWSPWISVGIMVDGKLSDDSADFTVIEDGERYGLVLDIF